MILSVMILILSSPGSVDSVAGCVPALSFFPGYCIGLLKGFRKLLAFGGVAQRLAQDHQLIVPEEMLEFFMRAGPIVPSADRFIFAGLWQRDGPPAPVPLI